MSDTTSPFLVTVRNGAIAAPCSVSSGWTRVRVEETEDAHIVVAFRLPANSTTTDVATFVAALDTAAGTPHPGVAIGGPEVGASGEVVLQFGKGVHVLACVRRDDDGHRHASRGEYRVLHVRGDKLASDSLPAPSASAQVVRMVDFAYVGPDQWSPGAGLMRIENTGKQDHQVRLARLRDGATLRAWMSAEDQDTIATSIAGMARVGPGETAYLPVDLTPGTYVVFCLIPDVATKRPHVMLGMLREIVVRNTSPSQTP